MKTILKEFLEKKNNLKGAKWIQEGTHEEAPAGIPAEVPEGTDEGISQEELLEEISAGTAGGIHPLVTEEIPKLILGVFRRKKTLEIHAEALEKFVDELELRN